PIVNPKVKGIILTPICPHSCFIRPMVIDESEKVALNIINIISMTKRSVNLTLDGQEGVDIEPDDEIIIEKANFPAQIVRFEDKNFYQTFMNKLCL
ncbi:MAG TPA: NAD(+)/NADH kinase, partial [Megamonas funiformis]|nr:NAD(+)/NADH kinase [Megamonas funiformis]